MKCTENPMFNRRHRQSSLWTKWRVKKDISFLYLWTRLGGLEIQQTFCIWCSAPSVPSVATRPAVLMQPIPINLARKMSIVAEIDIKHQGFGLKTKQKTKKTKRKSPINQQKIHFHHKTQKKREMTNKCEQIRISVAQAKHTLKRCQIKKWKKCRCWNWDKNNKAAFISIFLPTKVRLQIFPACRWFLPLFWERQSQAMCWGGGKGNGEWPSVTEASRQRGNKNRKTLPGRKNGKKRKEIKNTVKTPSKSNIISITKQTSDRWKTTWTTSSKERKRQKSCPTCEARATTDSRAIKHHSSSDKKGAKQKRTDGHCAKRIRITAIGLIIRQ